MKNFFKLSLLFFLLSLACVTPGVYGQEESIESLLESLPELISIEKMEADSFFREAYVIMVEQYLDHGNPSAGKFEQRIILSHLNKYSPVVMVTEGYTANRALKSNYRNELCPILEANQLVVEHRYFGKSTPENPDWKFLTIENAAADLHRIKNIFKRIYNFQNKWIATGVSKGGQNTLAYKAYYPNDMSLWLPYVGPVNFKLEDKRMAKFLSKVGKKKCRDLILDFQRDILSNRDTMQYYLDSLIDAKNYTFHITNEEVLDYCVLEYSFAFWQWGHICRDIPADTLSVKTRFNHLVEVSNPDYFDVESGKDILPFFIQAAKEFGYYAYDTKPFKDLLVIEDAKNYVYEIFLNDFEAFDFDKSTSKFISNSIQKDGKNVVLIYGECDPWTAGGIFPKSKSQAKVFIKPNGSHKTRFNNMSFAQRTEIYILLEKILEWN